MALYVVGNTLVRARNGAHALELLGLDDGIVQRVTEHGAFGVIEAETSDDLAEAPSGERREVDITSLSDRPGTRRFRDMDTGSERTEITEHE